MMKINKKLSSITSIFGLSLLASCSYGKAGVNVYVKNNCETTQYVESLVDNQKMPVEAVVSHQRLLLGYIDTGYLSDNIKVQYQVYQDTLNENKLGDVEINLDNYWSKNQYLAKTDSQNIAIDIPERSWQNWIGTPNITLELCPHQTLDILKDSLLDGVKRVVVFGDSLSDEGNLFSLTQGAIPSTRNYYNVMFSNGNTWSAMLRNALSTADIKLSNYAVGGATAIDHNTTNQLSYNLTYETYMYQSNALYENWHDAASTLAIIWIGGNDYLMQPATLDEKAQQQLTTEVVRAIKATIDELIASGMKKFIIFNLPDLSRVPSSIMINKNTQVTEKLTHQHNKELKQMIALLGQAYPSDYVFKEVDVSSLFQQFTDKSKCKAVNDQYHTMIEVTDLPCYRGGYSWVNIDLLKAAYSAYTEQLLPGLMSLKDMIYNSYQYFNVCSNPENYLFYDYVHPTAQIHEIIYQQLLLKAINS